MVDDSDKLRNIYVKSNARRKSVPDRVDRIGKLSIGEVLLLLDNVYLLNNIHEG